MNQTVATASPSLNRVPWYRRIGPGLITACVVIGPGSILTSSNVGAKYGFSMMWVVVLAVMFMMVYMTLGARLGSVANQSPGQLIADRWGRPMAALIGIGVFFISSAFQFGNNLGVHSAFAVYVNPEYADYTVIVFNAIAIGFLFAFRNLYRAVERLMSVFVGIMLISFAANLAFALRSRNLIDVTRDLTPRIGELDISVLGLVGTTFVVTAAFYQAYLVQQKGWGPNELQNGLIDARVGSVLMCLITLMLMGTAAAVLGGRELKSVGDVAESLKPLFGESGRLLFCIGLFSAAYSSFLVNSMIGGFILSDGLGIGSRPTDTSTRLLTVVVLLTGMGVALYVIQTGVMPMPAIVAAQAVTVLASPLLAGALWWLTNREDVMGDRRNSLMMNCCAGIGFVLLLAMAAYTAIEKVAPAVSQWIGPPA